MTGKPILKEEKQVRDPFLKAVDVVDPETGIILGVAWEYWHETARATTRSTTWSKRKRWAAVNFSIPYDFEVFNSRKAAVSHITAKANP